MRETRGHRKQSCQGNEAEGGRDCTKEGRLGVTGGRSLWRILGGLVAGLPRGE